VEGSRKLHQGLGTDGPGSGTVPARDWSQTTNEQPERNDAASDKSLRGDPAHRSAGGGPHATERGLLRVSTGPDLVSLCSWF
jgi:hypothetical protein